MKVKLKSNGMVGVSDSFALSTIGEVIVMWEDDLNNEFIRDLDVYLEEKDEWADMLTAFGNNDLISNNFNTEFREPQSIEERNQGYY